MENGIRKKMKTKTRKMDGKFSGRSRRLRLTERKWRFEDGVFYIYLYIFIMIRKLGERDGRFP